MASQLQAGVSKLRSTVSSYENELITLRARAKTAAATRKINEQVARVDSTGTIAMLEKMKAKVEEDESLAQSYGELASAETCVDDEINAALAGNQLSAPSDKLIALKTKMGLLE